MKRLRLAPLLLLVLAGSLTFGSTPARAATGSGPPGPTSKGGVLAAAGCGFAVASMVILPNPISAFVAGFDCALMFLDALESPDR